MGDVTTYETRIMGRCPNDGSPDDYDLVIVSVGVLIEVERVLAAVRTLTVRPVFQEVLTHRLRARIAAKDEDVTVTTVGWHHGVKTTCVSS